MVVFILLTLQMIYHAKNNHHTFFDCVHQFDTGVSVAMVDLGCCMFHDGLYREAFDGQQFLVGLFRNRFELADDDFN